VVSGVLNPRKMDQKKIVLLDCPDQDIFKKEFEFKHAYNIFAIQKKQNRKDWTLSEGQNYELTDGILTERTDSEDTSERKPTRRTRKLPEA
jgi:hypothetical protein